MKIKQVKFEKLENHQMKKITGGTGGDDKAGRFLVSGRGGDGGSSSSSGSSLSGNLAAMAKAAV